MRKQLIVAAVAATFSSLSWQASAADNLGLGVNYGAFSGPTLEISYPLSQTVQLRGAISGGMGLSEDDTTTDITYDVTADGGIHRLALDYHPFQNGFFMSAGYAINNFAIDADATVLRDEDLTIGDTEYTAEGKVRLNGNLDWDNAPTLSFGWGHSPAKGLGFMVEIGAYLTGAADVSLTGTGRVSDGTTSYSVANEIADDIRQEEKNLEDDVADYKFLPLLQAGITYRF